MALLQDIQGPKIRVGSFPGGGVELATESEVELPRGSLVLLYTDGLIERREMSLDQGLESLKEVLAEAPQDPDAALRWVEEGLEIEGIPDDVATLAMAIDP